MIVGTTDPRHAEAGLLEALEVFTDGFAVWDPDDRLLHCNTSFRGLHGALAPLCIPGTLHADLLRACHARGLFVEWRDKCAEDFVAARVAGHRNPGPPFETLMADGRWVRITEVPTPNGGIASQFTDITDLKRRQIALAARERDARTDDRLRMLSRAVEQSPAIIVITDQAGRIEYVNSRFTQVTGWEPDEVMGRTPRMLEPPDGGGKDYGAIRRAVAAGGDWCGEFRSMKKNGEVYWEHASISAVRSEDGEITHFLAVKADLTELKDAEEALRSSERRLSFLLRHVPEGIVMTDEEGLIELMNPAAEDIFGLTREEAIGTPFHRFVHGSSREDYLAICSGPPRRDGQSAAGEITGVRSDGTLFPLEMTVSSGERIDGERSLIKILRDVTRRHRREAERQAMEKELQQARKMEALGQLAGGMAHEFNNMLVPIIALTELAIADLPADSQGRGHLETSLQAALRARQLVRQIFTFSRSAEANEDSVLLGEALSEIAELLQATLNASIKIRCSAAGPHMAAARVRMSATELHQIMLNFASNSAAAIGTRKGTLDITLAPATEADLRPFAGKLAAGDYVKLAVVDDGKGMDEATRMRVFEPFFTTKPVGEGTGMGLAVVHGIVERCGGAISVASEPGRGTTFTILIPVSPLSA